MYWKFYYFINKTFDLFYVKGKPLHTILHLFLLHKWQTSSTTYFLFMLLEVLMQATMLYLIIISLYLYY